MFKFLFKNLYDIEPNSFGLDISDKSFKFVQLRKTKNGIETVAFGAGDIQSGIIENGEIKNEDALAQILLNAFKNPIKGKLSTKYVVCSLPEQHSFIRVLQLPKMSHGETNEAIKWEIEQNIPLSINEVYFDWQFIIGDKSLDHQDILISAVAKNVVDPYVSVLKKAGLMPIALEVESIAVARSVIKNLSTDYPVFLVDIGGTTTSFIIFSGNTLRFTSSIPVAGDAMVDAIAKNIGVDKNKASQIFYEVGLDKSLDPDGKVAQPLINVLSELALQIGNYMSFYQSHSEHDHFLKEAGIKKIILSGGAANTTGVAAYLSLALKIPVEMANPWTNILEEPLKEIPDLSYKKSLSYTTSLGLALRDIK